MPLGLLHPTVPMKSEHRGTQPAQIFLYKLNALAIRPNTNYLITTGTATCLTAFYLKQSGRLAARTNIH